MKTYRRNWKALTSGLLLLALAAGAAGARAEEANIVREGTWTKVRARTEGGWSIVERDGALELVLDARFRTKDAPDLKLFLTPWELSQLDSETVTVRALRLGPLKSDRGEQRYAIPAGTDLSRYRSLAIHCEKYAELWAKAAL